MYRKNSKEAALKPVEEQIIFALAMLEGVGGYYVEEIERENVFYSGVAIGYILGGVWSTYRARTCIGLVDKSWVETRSVGRLRYYRLSLAGIQWVNELLFTAKQGRERRFAQKGQEQLFVEMGVGQ